MRWFSPLLAFILLVTPAAAAANLTKVTTLDQSGAIPFNIWVGAIIMGLVMIILSCGQFPHGEEGLISITAWFPIGFAAYASFAVDRITSTAFTTDALGNPVLIENHTIHQFPIIALILLVLTVFAIGNTFRIYGNQTKAAMGGRRPP